MSSFSIFLVGFVIIVIALIYAATLIGLPTQWIVVGAVLLVGIGVVMGVSQTKRKDPPES